MVATTPLLSIDAYVCMADGRLVFSNIRSDKYQCLSRKNTLALLQLVPDFPGCDEISASELADISHERSRIVVGALTREGLIVASTDAGKPFAPILTSVPTVSPVSTKPNRQPQVRPSHFASFLRASLAASAMLRFWPLQRIVERVQLRKQRYRKTGSNDSCSLVDASTLFDHLRPFYVRNYLCRFDSLALIEFLALRCLFPTWIFGVSSEPFGAHCWIQQEDCVLNDTVEYVTRFTPIMAF